MVSLGSEELRDRGSVLCIDKTGELIRDAAGRCIHKVISYNVKTDSDVRLKRSSIILFRDVR